MHISEELIRLLIIIHAVAGGLALLSGSLALILKKGSKQHILSGRIFFGSMMVVCILSIFVSSVENHYNFFLFIIGIFSMYMVITGILYVHDRKKSKQVVISWFGLISFLMMTFTICFFYLGIGNIIGKGILPFFPMNSSSAKGIIMLVFGSFSLLFLREDIRWFLGGDLGKTFWLRGHLTRMTACYIAAFTAFIVVNNKILPGLVAWLLPSLIGVPIMIYHSNKLKKSETK